MPADVQKALVLFAIGQVVADQRKIFDHHNHPLRSFTSQPSDSGRDTLWIMKVASLQFALLAELASNAHWEEVAELLEANSELISKRIRGEIDANEFERQGMANDAARSRTLAPYSQLLRRYERAAEPWSAAFEEIAQMIIGRAKLAATESMVRQDSGTQATPSDAGTDEANASALEELVDLFVGLLREVTLRPERNAVDAWASAMKWHRASDDVAEAANAKTAYLVKRPPEGIIVGHDDTPTLFSVAMDSGFDYEVVRQELLAYMALHELYDETSLGQRSTMFRVEDGGEVLGVIMIVAGTHPRTIGAGSVSFMTAERSEEAMGRSLVP